MKKATIFLLIAATLLFSACDQGEMTLPNDNTLPAATEYVLGKPIDKACSYLKMKGYTSASIDGYEDGYNFERGEKMEEYNGAAEEWLYLQTMTGSGDTVREVYANRLFHNSRDEISVYRKWSDYTWNTVCRNPQNWWAGISRIVRNPKTGMVISSDDQNFLDGTDEKERVEEEIPDRKAFVKQLSDTTHLSSIFEEYTRISKNKYKEVEVRYSSTHEFMITYINRDFDYYDVIIPPSPAK